MSLHKVGRFFWLDIYVGRKRVRRSLKTGNKFEALDEYKKVKDKLLAEHRGGDVGFADFAKKYLNWAWSSKPASADREEQRLKKIEAFFKDLGIVFLSDITPYHVEQLKAHLLKKGRAIAAKARSPLQKAFPDLILFAAHTGLRKAEILNLRSKDVREEEVTVLGKGSQRRTVPLNKAARTVLDWQLRRGEYVFDIPNRDRKDLFMRTIA